MDEVTQENPFFGTLIDPKFVCKIRFLGIANFK